MSAKHTPGPWHQYNGNVHKDDTGDKCRPIKRIIADCDSQSVGESEAFANACLIAAAPELLEALSIAHRLISDLRDVGRHVGVLGNVNVDLMLRDRLNGSEETCRAAISKAEGRS